VWQWAVLLFGGGLTCLGLRYGVPRWKVVSILLEFLGVALIALGLSVVFCMLLWWLT